MIRFLIRFLLSILLLHGTVFSLVSCTTASEDESAESDSGPVDDEESQAANESGSEDTDDGLDEPEEDSDAAQAKEEAPDEQDLESEFEQDKQEVAGADDQLDDGLSKDDLEDKPIETPPPVTTENVEPAPETVPAPSVEQVERARIRDIRYLANSSGGTVVIETSKPIAYQTRMNPNTIQFVIEIADVELPPALQRPYEMKNMNSRIGGINAYQAAGSSTARVVIQLSGAPGSEPIVQQEGTSLVVIPPSAPPPPVAQAEPPKPAPKAETALAARTLDEFLTGNQKFYRRIS